MTYREIVSKLFHPDIEMYVPAGIMHSWPIPGKNGDTTVDCYFIHSSVDEKLSVHAPFSVLKIDTSKPKLISYEKNENPAVIKVKQIDPELEDRFEEMYPAMRESAFKPSLTPAEAENAKKALACLEEMAGEDMMGIYKEISPEFFRWVQQL